MNRKTWIPQLSTTDLLRGMLLMVLVIIGTFPENDWSYNLGIDPPLSWAFNHLFETGLNKGIHIIFPHGPLAFFMYPLSNNILLATLVTSLLKGLLVFNLIFLFCESKNQGKWIAAFVTAYLISLLSLFNHLILANIILLYCNYYQTNYKPFKLFAFLLTAFALFVKAYVAIVSGTLFFAFVIYFLVKHRNGKQTLFDGISLLIFIVMFWLLMFGTLRGLFNYINGMLHLAQDNSAAAAYYPQNNWLVLIIFMLTVVAIFVVNRSQKSLFFGSLIALSLFASWKHAMAREDIFHTKGLLIYLVICFALFIFFERKNYLTNLILSVVSLFLFSVNMKNAENYFAYKYELFSVNNFVEYVRDFEQLKEKSLRNSERKVAQNKLPQAMLDSVSNATVDIYPWDYSIAAINKLNWQPRVVIQSYAAYTSWLDAQNAQHFASDNAPQYLIWENKKITRDVNGGDMNSIDMRYLLNDEPHTILQLIANYDYCFSDKKFSLYKKKKKPVLPETNPIGKAETTWNEWLPLPDFTGDILRAKLNFGKSTIQRVKSFLFKDEQFWLYMKLSDKSIHKYRIVPKNAADGLWLSPYIFDQNRLYNIEQIMFKSSKSELLEQQLTVEWEKIDFGPSSHGILQFFGLNPQFSDSLIFSSTNNFEQASLEHWSTTKKEQFSPKAFTGVSSYFLKENMYSSTLKLSLDSIPYGDIRICADAWVNSLGNSSVKDISLVVAIDGKNGNLTYKGLSTKEQLIDPKQWNNIFKSIEFNHRQSGCNLVVYFWSSGKEQLLIDDFRVMIFSNKEQNSAN